MKIANIIILKLTSGKTVHLQAAVNIPARQAGSVGRRSCPAESK